MKKIFILSILLLVFSFNYAQTPVNVPNNAISITLI